eukprot:GFYU01001303.1.p1 GENE.GFYU01001303.1~~GFYU01001303.1.p1  ORF type:complete len:374 (-),score=111.14 GFYU01001303.1:85-1158(-)
MAKSFVDWKREKNTQFQQLDSPQMQQLYTTFCSFGSGKAEAQMDGAKFAKFCKDCKVNGKTFTPTDADLIFTKVKQKGERKIGYEQFLVALCLAADKKKTTPLELADKVLAAGGPASSGTVADSGGILDKMTDASQYTGAHQARFDADGKGMGASGRRDDKINDLSQMTRPGLDGVAGNDLGGKPQYEARQTSPQKSPRGGPPSEGKSKKAASSAPAGPPADSLESVFEAYCSFGGGASKVEMDGAKWAKFCKNSNLLDKKFVQTDIDIIFAKVKGKTERKIIFMQFEEALGHVAAKKGISYEELKDIVLASGGPASSGTKAQGGGIYDKLTDSSQYTGAHKERFDAEGQGRGAAGR